MASPEYNRAYYAKNREHLKARAHEHYLANRERHLETSKAWHHENRERALANQRRWYRENRERVLARQKETGRKERLARQYGLTEEQFAAIAEAQGGLCAICEKACDVGPNLSVDHSHDSGEVRGLLCRRCNSGLGFFREDIDLLARAVAYLTKPEVSNAA